MTRPFEFNHLLRVYSGLDLFIANETATTS